MKNFTKMTVAVALMISLGAMAQSQSSGSDATGSNSTNNAITGGSGANSASVGALATGIIGDGLVNNSHNTTTNINNGGVSQANNVIQQSAQQTIKSNQAVMLAPLTTSGMDTCLGSMTGGISVPGFTAGGGGTITDQNCVMLKNSKRLQELGLNDAALMLLVLSNDKIKEALLTTNPEIYKALTTKGTAGQEGKLLSGAKSN